MVGEGKSKVENPAEALRNQDGTFKAISPYGHIFQVTCRKGSNRRIRQIGDRSETQLLSEPRRWKIEKIP
jgi:hypothetical protein